MVRSGPSNGLGRPRAWGCAAGIATGRHRWITSSRRCLSRPDGGCQRATTALRPGRRHPTFSSKGPGGTPLFETPRGVGVHRLTPQPGHGRRPLSDGAHHGRMGAVSGPPRRHDRDGATHRDRCEARMASQHASIIYDEDLMATQAPTSGGRGGRPVIPPSSPSQTSQTCVSVPR